MREHVKLNIATDSRQMVTLLDLRGDGAERLWCDEELGAILKHQMSAPLLKVTKDFAKACRLRPHGPLSREIASILYFVRSKLTPKHTHERHQLHLADGAPADLVIDRRATS